jgi:hypothetical protein
MSLKRSDVISRDMIKRDVTERDVVIRDVMGCDIITDAKATVVSCYGSSL